MRSIHYGGHFTDGTSRLPEDDHPSFSIDHGDVDGDGDIDLMIGNYMNEGHSNRLPLNDGSGMFAQSGDRSGGSSRTLTLPSEVDGDRLSHGYKDGVPVIMTPKLVHAGLLQRVEIVECDVDRTLAVD